MGVVWKFEAFVKELIQIAPLSALQSCLQLHFHDLEVLADDISLGGLSQSVHTLSSCEAKCSAVLLNIEIVFQLWTDQQVRSIL